MIDDFHLESLTSEELSSLRQALDAEEKRRTRQSRLDDLDNQIAQLQAELPTASSVHDTILRATRYSGGWAPSQACHCRTCLSAEIQILQSRREFMLEVMK